MPLILFILSSKHNFQKLIDSIAVGMILSFLEMGILGLTLSMCISRCTGSSAATRYCAVIFPSVTMSV